MNRFSITIFLLYYFTAKCTVQGEYLYVLILEARQTFFLFFSFFLSTAILTKVSLVKLSIVEREDDLSIEQSYDDYSQVNVFMIKSFLFFFNSNYFFKRAIHFDAVCLISVFSFRSILTV